jgi:hypothetical protein
MGNQAEIELGQLNVHKREIIQPYDLMATGPYPGFFRRPLIPLLSGQKKPRYEARQPLNPIIN